MSERGEAASRQFAETLSKSWNLTPEDAAEFTRRAILLGDLYESRLKHRANMICLQASSDEERDLALALMAEEEKQTWRENLDKLSAEFVQKAQAETKWDNTGCIGVVISGALLLLLLAYC